MSDELEVIPVDFKDVDDNDLVLAMMSTGKSVGLRYTLLDEEGHTAEATLVRIDMREAIMRFQPDYVAHLSNDDNPKQTACGEPWQGWQAPEDIDLRDIILPPHTPPQGGSVRQCQACAKVAAAKVAEDV